MYTFVFKNGGWWLSVSDIQTLIDFHDKTDSCLFGDALSFSLDEKDQGHSAYEAGATLDQAITVLAESTGSSWLGAASRKKSGTRSNEDVKSIIDYGIDKLSATSYTAKD